MRAGAGSQVDAEPMVKLMREAEVTGLLKLAYMLPSASAFELMLVLDGAVELGEARP